MTLTMVPVHFLTLVSQLSASESFLLSETRSLQAGRIPHTWQWPASSPGKCSIFPPSFSWEGCPVSRLTALPEGKFPWGRNRTEDGPGSRLTLSTLVGGIPGQP